MVVSSGCWKHWPRWLMKSCLNSTSRNRSTLYLLGDQNRFNIWMASWKHRFAIRDDLVWCSGLQGNSGQCCQYKIYVDNSLDLLDRNRFFPLSLSLVDGLTFMTIITGRRSPCSLPLLTSNVPVEEVTQVLDAISLVIAAKLSSFTHSSWWSSKIALKSRLKISY